MRIVAGTVSLLMGVLAVTGARAAGAADASGPGASAAFITLGTQGGPLASAARSQPANALLVGQDLYLVDAGDGTVGQLAKAGLNLLPLRAVFLSHLHQDHAGGLAAVLGLRNQIDGPGVVTVYGPPGTKVLVEGLLASMKPSAEAGYGLPGESWSPPSERVRVVEIGDGAKIDLAGLKVSAVQNTHYSFPPGGDMDQRYKSLSLRFELPGRTVVYTGDTGPSPAVERLARGADLLVSEMIDVEQTVQNVTRTRPDLSPDERKELVAHLTDHHLTPLQVGELAARAGVKGLVITHLVPGRMGPAEQERYLRDIRRNYAGPVTIANDLDRF